MRCWCTSGPSTPHGPPSRRRTTRSIRSARVGGRLILEPMAGRFDDIQRHPGIPEADRLGCPLLEILVHAEEVVDLCQKGRRKVGKVADVRPCGIPETNAQYLLVRSLLVPHHEHADRASPNPAAGEGGLVDEDQGVERVPILAECVRDEPVVRRIPRGREQHPVKEIPPVSGSISYLFREPPGISTTTVTISDPIGLTPGPRRPAPAPRPCLPTTASCPQVAFDAFDVLSRGRNCSTPYQWEFGLSSSPHWIFRQIQPSPLRS